MPDENLILFDAYLLMGATIEDSEPSDYRIAIRDGETVLQGKFEWRSAEDRGSDWRDLEIVGQDHA